MPLERQSNVVEDRIEVRRWNSAPNFILDLGKETFRLLDARPRRSADVQPELTGIDVRKEVAPNKGQQPEREQREAEKSNQRDSAMIEAPLQESRVRIAKPFEPRLKARWTR